jgi:hypothetical protein
MSLAELGSTNRPGHLLTNVVFSKLPENQNSSTYKKVATEAHSFSTLPH